MKKIKLLLICILLFSQVFVSKAYVIQEDISRPSIIKVNFLEKEKVLHNGDQLHVIIEASNCENYDTLYVYFIHRVQFARIQVKCLYNNNLKAYIGISEPLNESLPESSYAMTDGVLLENSITGECRDSGINKELLYKEIYWFIFNNNCYNGIHTGGTATCTTRAKCSICGQEYGITLPHTWGNYTTDQSPTIFAAGSESIKCTKCNAVKSDSVRTIAKLPSSVKLNSKSTVLQLKKSTTAVKISSYTAGDKVASWSSSNKKVATVDSKGKITAKKVGTATITVKMKSGAKASCKVKVQKQAVKTKSLTISHKSVTLKKGQKLQLKVTRNPITATEKIKFSTSNKKIVTVSSTGKITAKKKGKVTITAKSSNGKKVTCKVIVK